MPGTRSALYRTYRPSTFAEVIGQEHVTEPLARALRTGRIHHAYLFSGPRGCGKTSSARILARSLNCASGPTPEPCGTCESCVALAAQGPGHLDVVEIDAASYGGVEETRELRDRAAYGPVSSRYKVYVIDEAHMISKSGFNALLKLVEEPPEYLVFVFATTEPEKVIPTIRSRTFHYPFRLVPPATLRAHLARVCTAEGVVVADPVLSLVVRAGAGSVRDSLSVLDQLVSGAADGSVGYSDAVRLLGVTDDALLDEVVEGLTAGDGAAVFEAVERVVDAGIDPRRFGGDLLERLRDMILVQMVPDADQRGLIDVPADRMSRLVDQGARLGSATLSRYADTVHAGLVEMKGTTSPRLVLELICARLLLPEVSSPDGGLLQRIERLERRSHVDAPPAASAPPSAAVPASTPEPAAAPVTPPVRTPNAAPVRTSAAAPVRTPATVAPEAAPAPAVPEPTPTPVPVPAPADEMTLEDVRRLWPEILEAVKKRKRFAWLLLNDNATPLALSSGGLTVGFRNAGSRINFTKGGSDLVLREALLEVMGLDVAIRCGDDEAAATPRPAGGAGTVEPVPEPAPESDPPPDERAAVVDPEQSAVDLVSRSLGARKIGEWDNS